MENMLHRSMWQHFGTDCKELITMVGDPESWPSFSMESKEIKDLKSMFQDFKITYIHREQNETTYHLAKILS